MQRTINATVVNYGAAGSFSAQPWVYNTISGSGCGLTGTGGFSITQTNFSLGAGASTNLSWIFDDVSLPGGTNYVVLKVGGSGASAIFGTSTGLSTNYASLNGWVRGIRASCPDSGMATKITAFLYNPSPEPKTCKCALYRESDLKFVAETNAVVVAANNNAWVDFAFATPPAITAQNYFIVVFGYVGSGNYVGLCYASGTGTGIHKAATYPTFPSIYNGYTITNLNYLIYCTYMPSISGCQDGASTSFQVGVAQTGGLWGFTTDYDTGAYISGVVIALSPGGYSTISVDGNYTLGNVPAGAYTATASKTGYTSISNPVTIEAGLNKQMNVSLSPSVTIIDQTSGDSYMGVAQMIFPVEMGASYSAIAQPFRAGVDHIDAVDIYLTDMNPGLDPDGTMYVGIRSSLSGAYLTYAARNNNSLAQGWNRLNMDRASLTPGQLYYIVLYSNSTSGLKWGWGVMSPWNPPSDRRVWVLGNPPYGWNMTKYDGNYLQCGFSTIYL